ncbi:MAG: cation:proton antiporter [Zestosphaera sp.]
MGVEIFIAVALSQWVLLLLSKYGVPDIPIYVIAGMVLGNSCFTDQSLNDFLAEIVLIFLFFYAGVNVNMESVRRYLREALSLTLCGVTLTVVMVSSLLVYLGVDLITSLLVGVALANTATEVAVVTLRESRVDLIEFRNLVIAASFMDDLLLVVLIALTQSTVFKTPLTQGLSTVLLHVLFLAVPMLVSLTMSRRVSKVSWEGYVTFASALAFTTIFLASRVGVSEYFGVYVAGLTLSLLRLGRDPTLSYSTKLYSLLEHLTTMLRFFVTPFFFVIIGTYLNTSFIFNVYTPVLLATAFIGKFLGFLIYARVAMNLRTEESVLGGLVMNSRGSIESALALTAFTSGIIFKELFHGIIAVTVLSSIITPLMIRLIINARSIY